MGKDPAILFYTSDFISGTALMNFEQRGKYMTLLCLQHQHGHLSYEDMICICGNEDRKIFSKFIQDEQGMYFNKRLDEEMIKRRKHSEKQRDNVLKRWGKDIPRYYHGNTTVIPLEDENENEIINEDIIKNNKRKTLFKNSGITIEKISEAFLKTEDLKKADAEYYYNALLDWSDSGGKLGIDWIASARKWARRDLHEGKLKIVKPSALVRKSSNFDRIMETDYSRYSAPKDIKEILKR